MSYSLYLQCNFIRFNIFIFKSVKEFREKHLYIDKPLAIIAKLANVLLDLYPIFKLFLDILVSSD